MCPASTVGTLILLLTGDGNHHEALSPTSARPGKLSPMTPATRLADLLADARCSGATFAGVWAPSVTRALADAEPGEQGEWLGVLEATRDAWACAWERQPSSRVERALYAVAVDPDRVALPELACQRCGAAIPPERDKRAKWCGDRCRRAASDGRRATLAA